MSNLPTLRKEKAQQTPKKEEKNGIPPFHDGGEERIRTADPHVANVMLYQLSYFPVVETANSVSQPAVPRKRENQKFQRMSRSFHLTVCFYPIPALHFAENFAALPA